jgi:hypothetical protein
MSICCVHAQNKTIDLYEFIRAAIPDSGQTTTAVSWQKGVSGGTLVKWQKAAPVKGILGYSRNGMSKIKAGTGKPENIEVSLSGDKIGYNEIQLNKSLPEDYQMDKLLGTKSYKAQLIKKDDSGFPTYFYKLKIPGKKDVWCILQAEMPGTAVEDAEMSLDIIILFDYSEFKRRSS